MDRRPVVLALPFAGGASHSFAGLAKQCRVASLRALDYPGHGKRMSEPLQKTIPQLADTLFEEVAAIARGPKPYTLLGHSMGGAVAWLITLRLADEGLRLPRFLILSGSCPPWRRDGRETYLLPEPDFLREVAKLGAEGMKALEHPELRSLMLPILRADFEAIETFYARPRAIPGLAVVALFGAGDPDVGVDKASMWKDITSGTFLLQEFPGGHFFPFEEAGTQVAALLDTLHGPE